MKGSPPENFEKLSLKNGASRAHFYNWKLIKRLEINTLFRYLNDMKYYV